MKLVNLTRNVVAVYDHPLGTLQYELPPSLPTLDASFAAQEVAAVVTDDGRWGTPIVRHEFSLIDELPPREEGTFYVVGYAVLQALAVAGIQRPDLIAPDTGRESAVRDAKGRIVGVTRFRVI